MVFGLIAGGVRTVGITGWWRDYTVRIRTIKPEFYSNEKLSTLPEVTHYGMAAGLLTYADDEGYFNANPKLIKAALFPIRDASVSIPEMLEQLSSIDFIALIDGPDGRAYGHVVNFSEHQRVSHPTPSKIKQLLKSRKASRTTPEDSAQSPESSGVIREESRTPPDPLRPEGKGKEQGREGAELLRISTPAVLLTLNTGEEYPITESQRAEWETLFPAVDVQQELRRMRAWCIANPKRRKTRSGVLRFVTSWLSDEQNKGGKQNANRPSRRAEFEGAI